MLAWLLQSFRCNTYLKGLQVFDGPGINHLMERFYNKNAGGSFSKKLCYVAHALMQVMGLHNTAMRDDNQQQQSVQKKHSILVDVGVILEDESHRPEYVIVTTTKRETQEKCDVDGLAKDKGG